MASVTLAPRYEAQSDSAMCVCVQRAEIVSEDVVSIAIKQQQANNRIIEQSKWIAIKMAATIARK